jgi:hypothetical protein
MGGGPGHDFGQKEGKGLDGHGAGLASDSIIRGLQLRQGFRGASEEEKDVQSAEEA